MKFSISQAALQDLLQIVVSAVPTKSTLPILSNVFIEANQEGLALVATDLDLSIKTRGEAEVEKEGAITVPAKRIGEIVMAELRGLDQVAYIRFASVYRAFNDISEFLEELRPMLGDFAQAGHGQNKVDPEEG